MSTDNNFFSYMIGKVKEQQEQAIKRIACGAPKDYACYREEVGYLKGLETLEFICNEMRIEMEMSQNI